MATLHFAIQYFPPTCAETPHVALLSKHYLVSKPVSRQADKESASMGHKWFLDKSTTISYEVWVTKKKKSVLRFSDESQEQ